MCLCISVIICVFLSVYFSNYLCVLVFEFMLLVFLCLLICVLSQTFPVELLMKPIYLVGLICLLGVGGIIFQRGGRGDRRKVVGVGEFLMERGRGGGGREKREVLKPKNDLY